MKYFVVIVSLWTALALSSLAEIPFTEVRGVANTSRADKEGYTVALVTTEDGLISGVATIPNTPGEALDGRSQSVRLRLFDATNSEIARAFLLQKQSKDGCRLEFALRPDLLVNSYITVTYGDAQGNSRFIKIILGSFYVTKR